MVTAFRWLLRIFSLLVGLGAAGLGLVYYFAAGSLPDYNETYVAEGIGAPVEIVRDTADVPHVFGQTDADVYFALGFAHAQDRLWQMVMLRRTVQGRLSEVFGLETVQTDELMRTLDLYRLATRSVAAQDASTQTALDAYAKGVNAWIEVVNAQARGRGAPEFFVFGGEISYWQPADSIAILKLMALRSAGQAETEVLRARLSVLSDTWPRDLMPDAPGQGVAALPPYAALVPGVKRSY
ncbi:MAG: penicillin acylase family protein, partial [Albidovulum sp.]|uniref:penicillin acylase family protein n=1 Tax=Albidovulum sp. TaxID=1872424 RepID=UPI00132C5CA5